MVTPKMDFLHFALFLQNNYKSISFASHQNSQISTWIKDKILLCGKDDNFTCLFAECCFVN